jgi:5-methylcytosine-specific restriction endonuclease McrA
MDSRFHLGKGRFSPNSSSRFRISLSMITNRYSKVIAENLSKDKNHGTYSELLFDERWKSKRQEILIRDNNLCIVCNGNNKLQVHHRQYHFIRNLSQFKPPWDYTNNLLITLCENCHQRGHSKFNVPTIYI